MEIKEKYLISQIYLPKEIKILLMRKGIISIDQLCYYTEERLRKTLGVKKRAVQKIKKYLKRNGWNLFEIVPNNIYPLFMQMIVLFRKGETLEDIGLKFGLTRERIRQIINDNMSDEDKLIAIKQEHDINNKNYSKEARKNLIIYLGNVAKNFYLITDFVKKTKIPLNVIHMHLPEIAEVFNQKRGGYRETVIENFKFCCAKCGLSQTESMIKDDKDLYVYHKNGDKKDSSLKNLIPLCLSCFLKETRKKINIKNHFPKKEEFKL